MLTAANSVILVSAGIAASHMLSPLRDSYALCCLLALLGLATVAQLAILTRHHIVLLGVILGNGALAAGLATPGYTARWLLPIAAIGGATIGMLGAEHFERAGGSRRLGLGMRCGWAGLRILARRAPVLLIQCKAVAERPAQTIFRIAATIVLALGADRLMAIFHFDRRALSNRYPGNGGDEPPPGWLLSRAERHAWRDGELPGDAAASIALLARYATRGSCCCSMACR